MNYQKVTDYPPIDAYTDHGHTDAELRALLADFYLEVGITRPHPTTTATAEPAPAPPPRRP